MSLQQAGLITERRTEPTEVEGHSTDYHSVNFYLCQRWPETAILIPWDMNNTFSRSHQGYTVMPSYRDLSIDCASDG